MFSLRWFLSVMLFKVFHCSQILESMNIIQSEALFCLLEFLDDHIQHSIAEGININGNVPSYVESLRWVAKCQSPIVTMF